MKHCLCKVCQMSYFNIFVTCYALNVTFKTFLKLLDIYCNVTIFSICVIHSNFPNAFLTLYCISSSHVIYSQVLE